MNPVTHFVFSTNISILLFYPEASMLEIVIFNLFFGAFLDVDRFLAEALYKPQDRLRTWLQEPAGLLIIGMPMAAVLSTLRPIYFALTMIPYVIHLMLDYISVEKLRPFSPFHDFELFRTGMAFVSWPRQKWHEEEYGVSEIYFLAMSLLALAFTWVNLI